MALPNMAAEILACSSLEQHSIVFQGLEGCLAFGYGGEWEGWDARQKLHYPMACACVWAADTRPVTTQDRAGTSSGGGGRTSMM